MMVGRANVVVLDRELVDEINLAISAWQKENQRQKPRVTAVGLRATIHDICQKYGCSVDDFVVDGNQVRVFATKALATACDIKYLLNDTARLPMAAE